ncbi:hypothetical protein VTN77DRAFT_7848 [Rasamsonia byssochlamydoides]|uniref:uncharacterized protein n=1 Tax=Rasamsonia byssochlamydoides TaxID=89139 RepID=UPI00374413EE
MPLRGVPRLQRVSISYRITPAPGWIPDPEIEEHINTILKRVVKVRLAVKRAQMEMEKGSAPKIGTKASFSVSTAPLGTPYPLQKSFLLDSTATLHICNTRDRFKDFQEAEEGDYLLAGDTKVPIRGYGVVKIKARAVEGDGNCILAFHDVAFAPTFHTSLVSLDRAMQKGYSWDTKNGALEKDGKPICKVSRRHGQFVLEYNPISELVKQSKTMQFMVMP